MANLMLSFPIVMLANLPALAYSKMPTVVWIRSGKRWYLS